jgi:hypothetical protein
MREMTPAATAARLHAAIDEALLVFRRVDETRTAEPSRPGGWCAREVLGHLIDSACNNHRRFVLGQSAGIMRFDAYDQEEWVARQRYREVPWRDLVALWTSYNRHLAHVISCVPPEAAARRALAPDGAGEIDLAFLMDDYVTHLRHHVEQIRSRLLP